MVIRGKLTLDLLSSQLQEGLGQWCLAVCKGQVPGSFTMLSVITSPGYFHEYPKLETPGLGSFLREVCASDKEYCPEGEEYNFYIKELTFSRTHQSFWVPWSLCFSYWSWSSNKSHSCLLHGFTDVHSSDTGKKETGARWMGSGGSSRSWPLGVGNAIQEAWLASCPSHLSGGPGPLPVGNVMETLHHMMSNHWFTYMFWFEDVVLIHHKITSTHPTGKLVQNWD